MSTSTCVDVNMHPLSLFAGLDVLFLPVEDGLVLNRRSCSCTITLCPSLAHSHCALSLSLALFLPIPSLAPRLDNLIIGPTRPWALRGGIQFYKFSVRLF